MRLKAATLSLCVVAMAALGVKPADASRSDARSEVRPAAQRGAPAARSEAVRRVAHRTPAPRGEARGDWGGISCVPYARSITGMEVSGNGRDWWYNAAGRYARGHRPERGSVLAFPASGNMRAGHVAVVSRVIHSRLIEIDHANWGGPGIRRGTVMRGVKVVDVSEDNSWTRVRVQVGWTAENFGREYPTYGFIHNRPAGAYAAGDDFVRPVAHVRRQAAARPARPQAQSQARAAAPRAAQPIRTAQANPAQTRR
jgi:hypothetical protein